MVGYSIEEMLNKTWMEITHPDDLPNNLKIVEQRLLLGVSSQFSLKKRLLHKDGSTVWVKITTSPIMEDDGSSSLNSVIIEDITQQVQGERELAESRNRFEVAARGTFDGLWDWDIEKDLIWNSPRCMELLGYPRPGEY